jgi:hypothetical protein
MVIGIVLTVAGAIFQAYPGSGKQGDLLDCDKFHAAVICTAL